MINSTISGNDGASAAVATSTTPTPPARRGTNTIVAGNHGPRPRHQRPDHQRHLIGNGRQHRLRHTAARLARRYGGATQTVPLLPGSPAIAAGASGADIPTNDQRGVARTGHTDIGAFQSQGFTLAKTGGDNQSQQIQAPFHPSPSPSLPSRPAPPTTNPCRAAY